MLPPAFVQCVPFAGTNLNRNMDFVKNDTHTACLLTQFQRCCVKRVMSTELQNKVNKNEVMPEIMNFQVQVSSSYRQNKASHRR